MSSSAHRAHASLSMGRLARLLFVFMVLAVVVPGARAANWDKKDYELFDLVDELESHEGKNVNFYSLMGVPPSASIADINKAYKKMSLALHPDKNRHDPKAQGRFTRLGKIATILRDPSTRERYNHFYKNGVPRWRGTGYYYSRFRPGLGLVVSFLVFLANILQYIVGWVNYHVERRRIRGFVADARENLARRAPRAQGPPRVGRSIVEIGRKTVKCEVQGDGKIVFFPEDGAKIVLDEAEVARPSVWGVFLVTLPMWVVKSLVRLVTGKAGKKEKVGGEKEVDEEEEEEEEEVVEEEEEEAEEEKPKAAKVKRGDMPGSGKPSPAAAKVAGGRRRVVRR